jgi:hypothetical protein
MTDAKEVELVQTISGILTSIEEHTRACFALASRDKTDQFDIQANAQGSEIELPYNLKLFKKNLSNHAALHYDRELSQIEASLIQLSGIISEYLAIPREDYLPQITLTWLIRRRSAVYKISLDGVTLSAKLMSPARFAQELAAALLRHEKLGLQGRCYTYRASNLPTHGQIYVDIIAPSEGLAIARVGALLGMNLTEILEARQGAVTVARKDGDVAMKNEARNALEAIGLIAAS